MENTAYILLAEGFELMEALVPLDVLRRGKVKTLLVSCTNNLDVTSSNNVMIKADCLLKDVTSDGQLLIVPGGYPGYVNLRNDQEVVTLVKNYLEANKLVGSICGGPTVLGSNDLIKDYKFTCHSSVIKEMKSDLYVDQDVVIDRNFISAKGAGLSLEFALSLAKLICKEEDYENILKGMEIRG